MQTLSSARRTCIASESAVECTATVGMPSSRQARWMRSAISPRLAIRTLRNTRAPLLEDQQDFAVFDRRSRGDQDAGHGARLGGLDLVERLHRLDEQQGLSGGDLLTSCDVGGRPGFRRQIDNAYHR